MSHFATYVFHKNISVEDLLAPYSENLIVAPYIQYTKEQAIKKVRQEIEDYANGEIYQKYLADPEKYKQEHSDRLEHIKYLEEKFPKKLHWTDEECYEDQKSWYEDDEIDADGNLLSTYNPHTKWDWWDIGGRWNGEIREKDGSHINECYVGRVDWENTAVPFTFIDPTGFWHEKGEMGYWGIVFNQKYEDTEWDKAFKDFVSILDDDVRVTVVDCHI